MKTKNYIEEYNVIRVVATLLVVIGHAGYISPMTNYGGITFGDYMIPTAQRMVDLVVRLIYSFHMPLFFTLSGALFYLNVGENKFNTIKNVITVKAKRLLVPYFLCTLCYMVPIKAISGYWSNSTYVYKDIIYGQFFLYGNTHLWFLWVLFIVTIITWLLRKNDIFRVVFALVLWCCGCVLDIPQFGISRVLLNLIWFELGYQYGKRRNEIQSIVTVKSRKMALAIISTVVYILVLICYLRLAKGNEFVYGIVHLAGVTMSFSIAFLVTEEKAKQVLPYETILKHSMGIYLYSDPINYLILALLKNNTGSRIIGTNMGTLCIFVLRIGITLYLAILIDVIVRRHKVKLKKKEA